MFNLPFWGKSERKLVAGAMKMYIVVMLQMMIWSGYTITEWLSKHDHPLYNGIMFIVFFYLAVILGNYIMSSMKKTVFATFSSLAIYASFHFTMSLFI